MSNNRLAHIFRPYFDWLTYHFGNLAQESKRHNVSVGTIVEDFLSDRSRNSLFNDEMPKLCEEVDSFWKANAQLIDLELKRLPGLKAIFGGDLGPQTDEAIFQRAGLYFDSIVVPDPLSRVTSMMRMPTGASKRDDYYFLKHAITLVLHKEAYLSDVVPPIAVLAPIVERSEQSLLFEEITNMARIDCVALINRLYGTALDNYEGVRAFLSRFKNAQEASKAIMKPDLFLLDEHASPDPESQVEACIERAAQDWDLSRLQYNTRDADFVLYILFGRMMQANEVLLTAHAQGGHPLVTAPVSFHWLTSKLRMNQRLLAAHANRGGEVELALTNALLSKGQQWLGNIGMDALVRLRQKGQLAELRTIIRQEINNLANAPLDNLEAVVNQVDRNLSQVLMSHHEKVKEIDKEFRSSLAIKGTTFLVSVTAAIQPALTGILPEWIRPAAGVFGATSLKDVIQAVSNYYRQRKVLANSPVGILWNASKKANL